MHLATRGKLGLPGAFSGNCPMLSSEFPVSDISEFSGATCPENYRLHLPLSAATWQFDYVPHAAFGECSREHFFCTIAI